MTEKMPRFKNIVKGAQHNLSGRPRRKMLLRDTQADEVILGTSPVSCGCSHVVGSIELVLLQFPAHGGGAI